MIKILTSPADSSPTMKFVRPKVVENYIMRLRFRVPIICFATDATSRRLTEAPSTSMGHWYPRGPGQIGGMEGPCGTVAGLPKDET